MEKESFIDAFGDVPTDLAGDYSQLYIFRAEDFGAWYRRVRDAHEREVDGGVAGMTDADLAEHGLCRIGSAAMWDEVRDTKDRELSEEHGLVRMPVDADGVPIHVGDVMEWPYGNGEFIVEGIGGNTLFYIDKDSNECEWTAAGDKRHHHAPTVEDVLREFADEVWNRCCEGATASDSGIDGLVAECAAKLQLAGEDE
ncbi:MAG: hypothetical protein U0K60_09685 [Parafannyhessea umbonata]|nr:hypothetical protein [Parafannyhessea umbonata]